jgi:hypothetical protein
MGFLSSLFGSRKSAEVVEQRRREAAEINEEVAVAIEDCIAYIRASSSEMMRRCASFPPDETKLAMDCLKTLNFLDEQAVTAQGQANSTRAQIVAAGSSIEWDRLVRMLREWRLTSMQIKPQAEVTVAKLNNILDQAEALRR